MHTAYCKRGWKFFFHKWSMCEPVVIIWQPDPCRHVESLQTGTEWNGAILALMFKINRVAPDLGFGQPLRDSDGSCDLPQSHMGETVPMRLCVRPFLTGDSFNRGLGFSLMVQPKVDLCWQPIFSHSIGFEQKTAEQLQMTSVSKYQEVKFGGTHDTEAALR